MSVFENKTLLITGGTGSFGNAVLRRFLTSDIKEIRIFSRDEKKQDDMRHHLQAADVAIEVVKDEGNDITVPTNTDENILTKIVKLIKSYTGVVNKMVWMKG